MLARTAQAIATVAAVGAAAAVATGRAPLDAVAVAVLAAGCAAAARPVAARVVIRDGDAVASSTDTAVVAGAVTAGLVAIAAALGGFTAVGDARLWLAGGAAGWAVFELARALPPDREPATALVVAVAAAVLDPAYVALVALAGVRLWRSPRVRTRWIALVPALGAIATVVAAIVAVRTGVWRPVALAATLTDALGPLVAVAALAGVTVAVIAGSAIRAPHALAQPAVVAGALVASLHAGAPVAAVYVAAAIAAGVAVVRLAAVARWPLAQAWLGATAALLLALPAALDIALR